MICYFFGNGKTTPKSVVVGYGIKIFRLALFIMSPDHLDPL